MKSDMSKKESYATKFEVKKFNSKENIDLWQKRVKVLLVQQGLHKTLQGKSAKLIDKDWAEMDLKAVITI